MRLPLLVSIGVVSIADAVGGDGGVVSVADAGVGDSDGDDADVAAGTAFAPKQSAAALAAAFFLSAFRLSFALCKLRLFLAGIEPCGDLHTRIHKHSSVFDEK